MNTMQFLMEVLNWLQASPTNVIAAASVLTMLIRTPDPNTTWGRVYKVLDILAINFGHAKETGVIEPADVEKMAQQVAAILAKQPAPIVNPVIPHQ